MKTVGDFKKMGGEIVIGDEFLTTETKEVAPITEVLVERVNNCRYPNLEIVSFAWRTNTGEKPSFEGLIDVVHRNTDTFDCIDINSAIECTSWERVGLDSDIISWRPSLNQGGDSLDEFSNSGLSVLSHRAQTAMNTLEALNYSYNEAELWKPPLGKKPEFLDDKPVFTQEYLIRGGTNVGKVFAPCIEVFVGNRYTILRSESGKEYSRRTSKLVKRRIQTEREKAIDKAKLVIREWVKYDGDSIVNLANMLSDAECLKC